MIAALICVFSFVAFLQFFVSYCHAALVSTRHAELSDRVREIAGIAGKTVAPQDFGRLLQFLWLCPGENFHIWQVRAVALYYQFLGVINRLCRVLFPSAAAWADQGRQDCSQFAAVVLDRRIARMQDLLARQARNPI